MKRLHAAISLFLALAGAQAHSASPRHDTAEFLRVLENAYPVSKIFWTDRSLTARKWNSPDLAYGLPVPGKAEEVALIHFRSPLTTLSSPAGDSLASAAAQNLGSTFSRPTFVNDLATYVLAASDAHGSTAAELSAADLRLASDAAYPAAAARFLVIRARNGLPAATLPTEDDWSLPPPEAFAIPKKSGTSAPDLWWNHQRAIALGNLLEARLTLSLLRNAVASPKDKIFAALLPEAETRLERLSDPSGRPSIAADQQLRQILTLLSQHPIPPGGSLCDALDPLSTRDIMQRANLIAELLGPASPLYADHVLYLVQVRGESGAGLRPADLHIASRQLSSLYRSWHTVFLNLACADAANLSDPSEAKLALLNLASATQEIATNRFASTAAPVLQPALRDALARTAEKKFADHSLARPYAVQALLKCATATGDRAVFEADAATFLRPTETRLLQIFVRKAQMDAYLTTWPDQNAFLATARATIKELPSESSMHSVASRLFRASFLWPETDWKAEIVRLDTILPRAKPGQPPAPGANVLPGLLKQL